MNCEKEVEIVPTKLYLRFTIPRASEASASSSTSETANTQKESLVNDHHESAVHTESESSREKIYLRLPAFNSINPFTGRKRRIIERDVDSEEEEFHPSASILRNAKPASNSSQSTFGRFRVNPVDRQEYQRNYRASHHSQREQVPYLFI